ncbi:elongation factor Ts, mitochondrial-like isoform X2 [Gigantopelta aegis]|nr:elongation factor Ts, mitochondrial-like isoform X2 [Gigantopelta aegis]XP_041374513.1 elongation factor Ts, mitochondrial-like isoform X2 [Gigantopelta aegis]
MMRLWNWGIRGMSTGVDKSLLSKLRKKTGFPFINCKKALEQFDNDIKQAESWLKEQAQKEGWAKATKLQTRPMSQGLVGMITRDKSATMIEVNCETDFVARNTKFISLVAELVNVCQNQFASGNSKKISLSKSEVGELRSPDNKTLADLVALEVGSIGENMALRRVVHLQASPSSEIKTYIHVSGPQLNTNTDCVVGKFGALVELDASACNLDPASLLEISNELCQHIVGMNPQTIGRIDECESRQNKAEEMTQNKSEEMTQNKSEETTQNENEETPLETKDEEKTKIKEEESRLVCQEFLLDSSCTVGDILKENNLVIKDFVRFECGEELPEDEQ